MNQDSSHKLPKHLAIIMDGNGRWAQGRGLPRIAGHREGMKRAREIVEYVGELGIPYLTLFAFSTENWKRPKAEVNFLMRLLKDSIQQELAALIENNVRFLCSGRLHELPGSLAQDLAGLAQATAENSGLVLNLAVNYGGRAEIVDAVKLLCREVAAGKVAIDEINEDDFAKFLYQPELPPADLVIRPSGERRLSNFLLWQAAYAELVTLDTLWPSFTAVDLDRALDEYAQRERRFGGIAQ